MATVAQIVGSRTSLAYSGTELSLLLNGYYVQNTTAYDCTTNQPSDVIIEVNATPALAGFVGGSGLQAVVFIRESLDGTNFRSGPTSGNTTTDEPNLKKLGKVPTYDKATNNKLHVGFFSVAQALGYVPNSFYIVIRNDTGSAFTAGTVYTSEISNTVT